MVAPLHLLHRRAQSACRLFRLGDHGHEQMGNAIVLRQLHDFGVDEEELDVLGAGTEEQAHDDAVDTDGFTTARAARNEQVGHLAQVGHLGHTGNVLAQGNAQGRSHPQERLALKHTADINRGLFVVGHLDADSRLARDGGLHADIGHGEVQGDIVRQRGDAADLDARHRLHLVPGDRGAAGDIQHSGADAKALQRIHQLLGVGLELVLRAHIRFLGGTLKQLDGGVLILVGLHRLGFFGRGTGGGLLRGSRLFHGRCH